MSLVWPVLMKKYHQKIFSLLLGSEISKEVTKISGHFHKKKATQECLKIFKMATQRRFWSHCHRHRRWWRWNLGDSRFKPGPSFRDLGVEPMFGRLLPLLGLPVTTGSNWLILVLIKKNKDGLRRLSWTWWFLPYFKFSIK